MLRDKLQSDFTSLFEVSLIWLSDVFLLCDFQPLWKLLVDMVCHPVNCMNYAYIETVNWLIFGCFCITIRICIEKFVLNLLCAVVKRLFIFNTRQAVCCNITLLAFIWRGQLFGELNSQVLSLLTVVKPLSMHKYATGLAYVIHGQQETG